MKLVSGSLAIIAGILLPCFAEGAVVMVKSGSFFFDPTNVVINPGDRVVWTNTTAQTHDSRSTASPALWASPSLTNRGIFGFTFTNAGYYPYRCQQHQLQAPQQTGSVAVVNITLANALRTNNSAQFEIRGGRNGLKAVVESGDTLGTWAPLRTNIFPVSGTISFSDTNPPPTRRFYRSRVIP